MNRSVAVLVVVLAALAASLLLPSPGQVGAQVGGTIVGEVKFSGEAPANVVKVNKDNAACGEEKALETLVVGPNKGVKWAVASLVDGKEAKPDASKKVTLDQNGCVFKPHVVLVPAGGSLDILNNDGIMHNFHTFSTANPSVNKAQPKFKKVMTEKFDKPEIVQIKCDAHSWMSGWVVVTDSPHYAVTDDAGGFKLEGIPAGKQKVQIWHESLGKQVKEVEVKAGETVKVVFDLKKD
jgi:plastocyanin